MAMHPGTTVHRRLKRTPHRYVLVQRDKSCTPLYVLYNPTHSLQSVLRPSSASDWSVVKIYPHFLCPIGRCRGPLRRLHLTILPACGSVVPHYTGVSRSPTMDTSWGPDPARYSTY
eukprot:9334535-Pyramimonas_sp.AAC.1